MSDWIPSRSRADFDNMRQDRRDDGREQRGRPVQKDVKLNRGHPMAAARGDL